MSDHESQINRVEVGEQLHGGNDSAASQHPVNVDVEQVASTDVEAHENVTEGASIANADTSPAPSAGGPINLDRIRQLRVQQQSVLEAKKQPHPKRDSRPSRSTGQESEAGESESTGAAHSKKRSKANKVEVGVISTPPRVMPKVAVPSRRGPLSEDLELELSQVLSGDLDLDKVLVGDDSLQVGHELTEGQRIRAVVLKHHEENVFVSLGGPNEGVLSILQFEKPPEVGGQLEVIVRGYLVEEGLYDVTIPGSAIAVADWSEIKEGEIVEALVTGANTGGLECKVGNIRGFIPASQIAPYRVENLSEYVGQKVLCLISEANERRGNLVLSRRSVLERERVEQRAEKLAALEAGAAVTGTVRKITDFGAFVDLGGVDGLLHISQLSWERIKHPSELLEEGQQIQVRVDKVDPQSGKISLSYRSLQEHPWTNVQSRFPVGSVVKGTVSRLAEFGAFVKLATGVEGLVHLSEIAHYRVQRVSSVLQQDQEVDVKVLTIDEEKQRIGLSIKAARQPEATELTSDQTESLEPEESVVTTRPSNPKRSQPLKGGIGRDSGGERFGLKW